MNERYVTIGKKIEAGLRAAIPAVWVCAGLLTACTADDLPAPEAGEVPPATLPAAGIYVSGGRPDVALSTGKRYVEPGDTVSGPQIEGICKADRVDVFVFTAQHRFTGYPSLDELKYEMTKGFDLSVVGYDRYAEANCSLSKSEPVKYIYATALAYKAGEETRFTTELEEKKYSEPTLKVTAGQLIPELYYGVVHVDENSATSSDQWDYCEPVDEGKFQDDSFWWGKAAGGSSQLTFKFKGRIFRIVSQINLEVTEVEKALVDSMVLKADNYPRQITLYGTHGTNYPVAACTASNTSGATSVALDHVAFAEKDTLGATTVRLSSFFLPSEAGMHLSLYIHYRDSVMDSYGSKYLEKTYDLRPARSYYLTGADAKAYNVEKSELKNGEDLYVYDGSNYCFYSYANVRVNLSGHFENFAASDSKPEITIEVEPNFEKEHYYGDIDYKAN